MQLHQVHVTLRELRLVRREQSEAGNGQRRKGKNDSEKRISETCTIGPEA